MGTEALDYTYAEYVKKKSDEIQDNVGTKVTNDLHANVGDKGANADLITQVGDKGVNDDLHTKIGVPTADLATPLDAIDVLTKALGDGDLAAMKDELIDDATSLKNVVGIETSKTLGNTYDKAKAVDDSVGDMSLETLLVKLGSKSTDDDVFTKLKALYELAIPAGAGNVEDSMGDILLDQLKPRLPLSGTIATQADITGLSGIRKTTFGAENSVATALNGTTPVLLLDMGGASCSAKDTKLTGIRISFASAPAGTVSFWVEEGDGDGTGGAYKLFPYGASNALVDNEPEEFHEPVIVEGVVAGAGADGYRLYVVSTVVGDTMNVTLEELDKVEFG